jgi:hypothetical protein
MGPALLVYRRCAPTGARYARLRMGGAPLHKEGGKRAGLAHREGPLRGRLDE